MIRTKTLVNFIAQVPVNWIFEYYLKLDHKLDGREIRLTSVFNPSEKTPSMYLYVSRDGKYRFRDFSSGNRGSAVDMVAMLKGLSLSQAAMCILNDYNNYISANNYSSVEQTPHSKFQVVDYSARNWNSLDAKYWTSFGIGSKVLAKYNVMPLESYVFQNDQRKSVVKHHYIYGYFREDGLIYKIYQPKMVSSKFVKIRNYIQGSDQLKYAKPNLVIHSSLKDLMSFEQLGFKTMECVAPDSENTMIPDDMMWKLMDKYQTVITIFDNDEAGRKAVLKYKERYGVNGFTLDLEKDIADSVSKYGKQNVKDQLVPLLTECIYTCRRCPENSTSV